MLIAERYERRSLGIASNLDLSEWERIFANLKATAAAIDRVVHHSIILKFDVPSYRTSLARCPKVLQPHRHITFNNDVPNLNLESGR